MMIDPSKGLQSASPLQRPLSQPIRDSVQPNQTAEAQSLPQDDFQATVRVKVFPQDPLVGDPEVIELPKDLVGDRLSSARLRTQDRAPIAIADPDGNYDYQVGSPQFDQANAHGIVANTLMMYDRYLGTPAEWSFGGPLNVIPHKGTGKTAYFSRWDRSINFFEWDSPSLGKRVSTAQSADVIAHEIGHAVWDGLRPRAGYSGEAGAFHEAFGDCSALLHALQQESNLSKALEQNGGDMRTPSLLSRMAEEFGSGFNKEDKDPNNDDRLYYRTALNEFKYIDPKLLPDDDYPPTVPEDVLTREFHSFSRVWSGAFYRMLSAMYDGEKSGGAQALEALKTARDKLGQVWGQALHELPPTGIKFKVVSEAMLKTAARSGDLATFDRLAAVMVDRDLLDGQTVDRLRGNSTPQITLGDGKPETVLHSLSEELQLPEGFASEGEPTKLKDGRTVYLFSKPELHHPPGLSHQGDQIEIELRSGLAATFDAEGRLVSHYHTPVGEQEREEADLFVQDLLRRDRVKESAFDSQTENSTGQVYLARLLPDRDGVKVFERIPVFD
ncbi:MAG: hypothetical protein WC314_11820 [Vulcanimicrobiota bacterium]